MVKSDFTEAVFHVHSMEIGINSGGAYYSLRELICEEVCTNGCASLAAIALRNLANIVENMEPSDTPTDSHAASPDGALSSPLPSASDPHKTASDAPVCP